jgi:dynein heavy chain
LEEEMVQMQESACLFEVALPEYKQMKQCRKEIQLLKGLWDVIIYVRVRYTFGKHVFFFF